MKDRIKAVRKAARLNQTEFGASVGVAQGTIAAYENGSRRPLDSVILSICRVYGISRQWLTDGTGPMHAPYDPYEDTVVHVGRLFASENDDFRKRLISIVVHLSEEQLQDLEKLAKQIAGVD